jgi:hypothetical protein
MQDRCAYSILKFKSLGVGWSALGRHVGTTIHENQNIILDIIVVYLASPVSPPWTWFASLNPPPLTWVAWYYPFLPIRLPL